MHTVALIACTSRKGSLPAAAEFIYRSPLFSAARSYAERRTNQWFILSAKHGLLSPETIIDPYDETLLRMTDSARREWATGVYLSLSKIIPSGCRIIFLSGAAYRMHLEPLLAASGHETAAPLSSLGIGSQVAWLQKVSREAIRLSHMDRFYTLLERIGNQASSDRRLSMHSSASVNHPRGVYFFFESGERRMTAPFQHRVTRIGTHAVSEGSRATLWNRLRTHRGGADGIGNHRGSIFRLHVGDSLIRRAELQEIFSTWGVGQSAPKEIRQGEEEIELEVSLTIGQMPVLWLGVDDEPSADSDRTYIERNLIALLCGPTGPIDLPSSEWLGRWSSREAIRTSGLWNINHVYDDFDPTALDVLEQYIEIAEGHRNKPSHSLAPVGWRSRLSERKSASDQMSLL